MNVNETRERQTTFARSCGDTGAIVVKLPERVAIDEEYREVEEVNKLWIEVERRYGSIRVRVVGCPIYCDRIGNRLRLMYGEKAITDCRTEEKLKAAEYLRDYLIHRKAAVAAMNGDAVAALKKMRAALVAEGDAE